MFVRHQGTHILILLLYVDDITITGSDDTLLCDFIRDLGHEFAMKDLGPLHYFLGIEVLSTSNGLFLSQAKYAKEILEKADMIYAKPMCTPMMVGHKLSSSGDPLPDPSVYRSIVAALQYVTLTRPDLAFSVNSVCQHMHSPTSSHFKAVKRILRYLKGTMHHGLHFSSQRTLDNYGFCDADWAGCPDTGRYTRGYAIFLG